MTPYSVYRISCLYVNLLIDREGNCEYLSFEKTRVTGSRSFGNQQTVGKYLAILLFSLNNNGVYYENY